MKIEKVNENQIRCTLTREDLASRELKISELAYGTEKAKMLFRDMMQQANFEFGFEAEDIPLMIEAIPLNAECIVLIITKVEDPDELDTRFSRFAPSAQDEEDEEEDDDTTPEEMMDLFRRIQEKRSSVSAPAADQEPLSAPGKEAPSEDRNRSRIFALDSLHDVINAAQVVGQKFCGESVLYKDNERDNYLLILTQGEEDRDRFDRVCNILSEYGSVRKAPAAGHTFLQEHFRPLIAEGALESLAGIR